VNPKLLRLALAAALFAAWMGYLGYLVYTLPGPTNNPVVDALRPVPNDLPAVLSRPQFLVSALDVVGTVEDKDGQVKVREVLYSKGKSPPEPDASIRVVNLDKVRVLVRVSGEKDSQTEHWEERKPTALDSLPLGPCLLLLRPTDEKDEYEVVHLPSSPGARFMSPRIYLATAETLAEYHSLKKPEERDEHTSQ
jgi:hypothetical protein